MSRPSTLASALTLSTIAFTFRTLARLTTREFKVDGLPILLDVLKIGHDEKGKGKVLEGEESDQSTKQRRGIVTDVVPHASHHVFPIRETVTYMSKHQMDLGASDIMFTNSFNNKFFDLGQVIETHRGGGIFQPAVDRAVKLLQDGEWIHIFPEGKVNQQGTNPEGGLLRFKWGVGRIIMDSKIMPEIIPIWISGFDQVMPEPRNWPRFIPRPGAKISITVGQPLTSSIEPLVSSWRSMAEKESGTLGIGGDWESESAPTSQRQGETGGLAGDAQREVRGRGELIDGREQEVRMKIVDVLQEGVMRLGEEVERREGRFEKGLWSQSTKRST